MNIFSKNVNLKSKENKVINNTYKYNIETFLENVYTEKQRKNIYLCFYYINSSMPILQYLINKGNMNFYNLTNRDISTFNNDCYKFIKENFSFNVIKRGYREYNNNMYIFFQCKNKENVQNGVWCILDEICNKKKYLNDNISEDITSFFLNNKDFIYLTNKDDIRIEVPIVAFQNFNDELELMYYTKKKIYYDYENCNKKYIARYILFITCENIIFNEAYQYKVNYNIKPESIHK